MNLHTQSGKWLACIRAEGKTVYLKLHDTAIKAAKVYDIAALKYFGDYACLNFPELREQYLKAA